MIATSDFETQVIQTWDQLQPFQNDWDRWAQSNPFASFTWAQHWWQHYGHDAELFVLRVANQDQTIALMPWYRSTSLRRGRVLSFLGSGDVCSDYLSLLSNPEHADQAVASISAWLVENDLWDLIDWEVILEDDPAMSTLRANLSDHPTTTRPGHSVWRLTLDNDWDSYLKRLSKSHRKQVRRVQRKVLESCEFHVAETKQQWRQGMEILVDLHQKRWLQQGEPGVFACPRFDGFLHDVSRALLDRDQLRLFWLTYQDRPVACDIHFTSAPDTSPKITYAYQAGIEPELIDLEPGRAMVIATTQYAIENGFTCLDYLRGDEPYKAHFRAEPTATCDGRIVARRTGSQLRHQVWLAERTVRRVVKSGLSLTGWSRS